MNSDNGFVVVVDSSWYVGFIPFYIYFALRACPGAQVFIYLRGKLSDGIRNQIEILSPEGRWTVFENYKIDYPTNIFTTKALRWTILHDIDLMPKNLYIGDVDITVSIEEPSLFEQHLTHCSVIDLPYSNVIRGNQRRMTGLHFIKTCKYMKCMHDIIEKYDDYLKQGNTSQWKGSNEKLLYDMLNEADLLPKTTDGSSYNSLGYDPKFLNFRPHHGAHLGAFRTGGLTKKPSEYIKYYKSLQYSKYFIDFLNAFNENPILYNMINKTNHPIERIFKRTLSYTKHLVDKETKI